MKKCLSLLLCVALLVCFSACTRSQQEEKSNKTNTKIVTDADANAVSQSDNSSVDVTLPDGTITNAVTSDILICYFSCTGNTAQIASYISKANGGDLFEIVPKQPYSMEDLNYKSKAARSFDEYNNPKARPEISSKVSSWSTYKTVYLGYPIWYGDAPKIIYSFLDEYDCSGKTVIPFCTSSSTPISESESNLKRYSPKAKWQKGIRFDNASTEDDVKKIL